MITNSGTAPSAHPSNPSMTQSGTFDPAGWLVAFEASGGGYTVTDATLHLFVATCSPPKLMCPAGEMLDQLTIHDRAALQRWLESNQLCSMSANAQPSNDLPDTGSIEPTDGGMTMNMMSRIQAAEVSDIVAEKLPDIPMLAAMPGSRYAESRDWECAMKRYLDAEAAYQHYARTVYDPAHARMIAFEEANGMAQGSPAYTRDAVQALHARHGGIFAVPDDVGEMCDRLSDEAYEAEWVLRKMPAPDHAALRWKLDRFLTCDDNDGYTDSWSTDAIAQTIEDYRRLLAAPIVNFAD